MRPARAQGTAAGAPLTVSFSPEPQDTKNTVQGYLSGDPAALALVKAVYVEVLEGDQSVETDSAGYTSPNNSFSATTKSRLIEGQAVYVHVCMAGPSFKGSITSGMARIAGVSVAESSPSPAAGDTVFGQGIPANAKITDVSADGATITINANAAATATGVALQFVSSEYPNACIEETQTAGNLVEMDANSATVMVSSAYDLGRVKAYFSTGAEFKATGGALGSPAGFFGVNVDYNWLKFGPDRGPACFSKRDSPAFVHLASPAEGGKSCGKQPRYILVSSYFEGDLTQIPFSSGTTALNISSAQGEFLEGGIYAPIIPGKAQWRWRGQANGFFFSPLAKYTLLAPGGANLSTGFNAYRAYSGGFRLGHFRMPAHLDRHSPELLSYLDVTVGRWENFREMNGARGVRVDATGKYKIPYTVFYVGFEVNAGPGGSEYQTFVGTRIDPSSILGKILPSTN